MNTYRVIEDDEGAIVVLIGTGDEMLVYVFPHGTGHKVTECLDTLDRGESLRGWSGLLEPTGDQLRIIATGNKGNRILYPARMRSSGRAALGG